MNSAPISRANKLLRDRRFTSFLALFVISVVAALSATVVVERFVVLTSADRFVKDWEVSFLTEPKPVDKDIVIVAVKEDTLEGFQYRSPIDRAFLNNLLIKIGAAKPKAIGLDLLFDQPTEPEKDKELHDTIATLNVPLAVSYTEEPSIVSPDQLKYLRQFVPLSRRAMPNLAKDQYGTVRSIYPGAKDREGHYIPGFERVLAAYGGVKTPAVSVPIVWTKPPPGETSAFLELHAQVASLFPAQTFKDKIVLIGSDVTLDDRHRTPFSTTSDAGMMSGIAVHAYGIETLLHHAQSPYTGWQLNFVMALALAAFGAILGILNFHLLPRIGALIGMLALFWGLGGFFFVFANTLLDLLAPSLAMIASFSAMDSLTGRDARKQRQFIQGAFSRYVSPKVVEALIEDPSRMSLEGERREMTFLFTDIADFTTMSEKIDSKDLARVLNAYFEGVTAVVLRHDGMLDKFIGDAVFAIFNAPVDLSDHGSHGVRCAMEIDKFCESFRKEQNAAGIPLGITRIGVHTGTAVIGNFGSSSRFNYTAQGDAVNTAARLEGLNKEFGTHICVSGSTKILCDGIEFRPIGSVVLKGKAQSVEVWEPLHPGAMTPGQLERYREAFSRLHDPSGEALELLEALATELPDDPCVRHHVRHLRKGLRGMDLVMTEK
jgi:class 3 adenylate cyclase/CHASE2 domain-containing sensor protein